MTIKCVNYAVPESNSEWQDIDECIDLEDAEEEDSEVLKCLGEEVPEETKVGGLIWHCQATYDITALSHPHYVKRSNNTCIMITHTHTSSTNNLASPTQCLLGHFKPMKRQRLCLALRTRNGRLRVIT